MLRDLLGKDIVENAKEDAKGILNDARKELATIKEEYESIKSLRDNTIQDINELKDKIKFRFRYYWRRG